MPPPSSLASEPLFSELLAVAQRLASMSQSQLALLKHRLQPQDAPASATTASTPAVASPRDTARATPLATPMHRTLSSGSLAALAGGAAAGQPGSTVSHIASLGSKGSSGNKLLRLLQTVKRLDEGRDHKLHDVFADLWTQLEVCVGLAARREGLDDEDDDGDADSVRSGPGAGGGGGGNGQGARGLRGRRTRGGAGGDAGGAGGGGGGGVANRAGRRLPRLRSGSIHGVYGADAEPAKQISASGSALLQRFVPLIRAFFLAHDLKSDAELDKQELARRAAAANNITVVPAADASAASGGAASTDAASKAQDTGSPPPLVPSPRLTARPASAASGASPANVGHVGASTGRVEYSLARQRLVNFVENNYIVLNAIVRQSAGAWHVCGLHSSAVGREPV